MRNLKNPITFPGDPCAGCGALITNNGIFVITDTGKKIIVAALLACIFLFSGFDGRAQTTIHNLPPVGTLAPSAVFITEQGSGWKTRKITAAQIKAYVNAGISAATPPTGNPNQVAYFDGTGALTYSPNFNFYQTTASFSVGGIIGNGTVLSLDDNSTYIHASTPYGTFSAGDVASNGNHTMFTVSDNGSSIYSQANQSIAFGNMNGYNWLTLIPNQHRTTIGDVDQNFNATRITVDDINKTIIQTDSVFQNNGKVQIIDGTEGLNKILTCGNNGLASWQPNAAPTISSGAIAPASTPAKVGDVYIDTVAKKLYFATGTASSADWEIAN